MTQPWRISANGPHESTIIIDPTENDAQQTHVYILWDTVEYSYNAVQYCELSTGIQELRQNIYQMLNPQGVSLSCDRVITAPHCIMYKDLGFYAL